MKTTSQGPSVLPPDTLDFLLFALDTYAFTLRVFTNEERLFQRLFILFLFRQTSPLNDKKTVPAMEVVLSSWLDVMPFLEHSGRLYKHSSLWCRKANEIMKQLNKEDIPSEWYQLVNLADYFHAKVKSAARF